MKNKDEKTAIIRKIKDNPDMTLHEIASDFGLSYDAFYRRMKLHGIEHGRKRGARPGNLKPIKID